MTAHSSVETDTAPVSRPGEFANRHVEPGCAARDRIRSALRSFRPVMAGLALCSVEGLCSAAEPPLPVPPPEHPRLFLRAADVAALPARLASPALAPALARVEAMAAQSPQYRVEWEALQQLIAPDATRGRAIVAETLALLRASGLPDPKDAERLHTYPSRITGRMMVTGAMVYDWLYPRLTTEDRQAFIAELVRLAQTLESGYPPTRGGYVNGHSSEAMIMRDLLAAGVAIHDEAPEMYAIAAGLFFRELRPARNWFYPGQAYHQGDSYSPHRFAFDLFPQFIFDRLGAGNVYDPGQRFVPYHWIYTTRPDGQRLRAGDTFKHRTDWGRPWDDWVATLLTASYHHDGVLLDQFRRMGATTDDDVFDGSIFEVLWRDTALQPVPVETLPFSRYFGPPFGWMVARTGWDDDAVIAELKINEYNFANHQHLDAGAFQIYHRGALAIDSGLYQGGSSGGYGSPHTKNYSWRTIAHNALLVYDPAEQFDPKNGFGNDGGQRLPNGRAAPRTLAELQAPKNGYRTGRVLAHGFGPDAHAPDYTLLQGDLTAAYSAKVSAVTRSFVFLNLRHARVPAALIVLDRVVSADPAFRKSWLLHTVEEPRIAGAQATVDRTERNDHGRLNLDVLLPAADNLDLGKVGGPGKEYWVSGANYENTVDPADLIRNSMEPGNWRIELSPKRPVAEDLFLTVMQTTDSAAPVRLPVTRLEAGERTGCVLTDGDHAWGVLLRKDSGRSATPVTFTLPGAGPCRILIADLAPGRWQARRTDGHGTVAFEVTPASGVGWFEGPAGEWTVHPSDAR